MFAIVHRLAQLRTIVCNGVAWRTFVCTCPLLCSIALLCAILHKHARTHAHTRTHAHIRGSDAPIECRHGFSPGLAAKHHRTHRLPTHTHDPTHTTRTHTKSNICPTPLPPAHTPSSHTQTHTHTHTNERMCARALVNVHAWSSTKKNTDTRTQNRTDHNCARSSPLTKTQTKSLVSPARKCSPQIPTTDQSHPSQNNPKSATWINKTRSAGLSATSNSSGPLLKNSKCPHAQMSNRSQTLVCSFNPRTFIISPGALPESANIDHLVHSCNTRTLVISRNPRKFVICCTSATLEHRTCWARPQSSDIRHLVHVRNPRTSAIWCIPAILEQRSFCALPQSSNICHSVHLRNPRTFIIWCTSTILAHRSFGASPAILERRSMGALRFRLLSLPITM